MANERKFIALNPDLYEYVVAHGKNSDSLLRELAEETSKFGRISAMQITAEQGNFMQLLTAAIGARSAVEVGTFTGYSSICVARALPSDGRLLCCDVSDEWTAVARRYWERAGVAGKITLKLAPALDTLRTLPDDHSFDFAFIDADKSSYRLYYEEILRRTRAGGLILFDNVLWNGAVIDPADQSEDTRAIRELNDFLVTDPRVDTVLLPIADGLTVCRKR
ncbi:MAG TPA: class I SAM-dependent methyltransferase [Candidatus Binataceae bacterium]|nr:class I SAM-dependent methyltransferase [Candidatus Binataceae bacterium]